MSTHQHQSVDRVASLPCEILGLVMRGAVTGNWFEGGGLAGLSACRAVSRSWHAACMSDEVVAAAATKLSGRVRLCKMLGASGTEAELAPAGRMPTHDEAAVLIQAMCTSPKGPAAHRIAARASRKRIALAHPLSVIKAVKRRERLIESSRSKRNRLPLLRAYDADAADWYEWWTQELATLGAYHAYRAGLDPF